MMIDHLVYASNDLPSASTTVADLLGDRSDAGRAPRRPRHVQRVARPRRRHLPRGDRARSHTTGTRGAATVRHRRPRRAGTGRVVCSPDTTAQRDHRRCPGRRHRTRRCGCDVSPPTGRCAVGVEADVPTTHRSLRARTPLHDRLGRLAASDRHAAGRGATRRAGCHASRHRAAADRVRHHRNHERRPTSRGRASALRATIAAQAGEVTLSS